MLTSSSSSFIQNLKLIWIDIKYSNNNVSLVSLEKEIFSICSVVRNKEICLSTIILVFIICITFFFYYLLVCMEFKWFIQSFQLRVGLIHCQGMILVHRMIGKGLGGTAASVFIQVVILLFWIWHLNSVFHVCL